MINVFRVVKRTGRARTPQRSDGAPEIPRDFVSLSLHQAQPYGPTGVDVYAPRNRLGNPLDIAPDGAH